MLIYAAAYRVVKKIALAMYSIATDLLSPAEMDLQFTQIEFNVLALA
jgi:hypothetical protein